MITNEDLRDRYSLSKKDWRLFAANMSAAHPHVKWASGHKLDAYSPWQPDGDEPAFLSGNKRIGISCNAKPRDFTVEEFLGVDGASINWEPWDERRTVGEFRNLFLDVSQYLGHSNTPPFEF